MSLRVRLIVAFFLFSVVPLAAVTLYSYASNVRAIHAATQHETELLTGELTQRMQVVTAQISDRVEHLMDVPMGTATATGTSGSALPPAPRTVARRAPAPRTPAPAVPTAPAPAPEPTVAVTGTVDTKAIEGQVAGALGEVAMLLNNVEVRGLSRFGGRFGAPQPGVPPQPGAATQEGPRRYRFSGPRPDRQPGDAGAPSAPPPPPGAAAEPPDPDADSTRLKIDLAPIRRELFREMAPSGSLEQMTPEERQRIGREVNQRLLGIVQGLQLSAAEVQKKAEAAKEQATADAKAASEAATTAAQKPVPPPVPPAAPAPAAPAPPAAQAAPAPAPQPRSAPQTRSTSSTAMTRKAALTGTRLNVRLESDGKVVQQVNAEINLPNLLATVFANTRRDRGEIPFAIGKDGHLYAPTDTDRASLSTLDLSRVEAVPGTSQIGNWVVVTMPDRSGAGLRFGIARPVGNLLNDLRRTTARNAGFGLLFIAIALTGIVPLSSRLTRNLTSLTDGVGRIAHGDYTARVPVTSRDEVGRLAAAFNQMAADVEQHQRSAVEQERIRRELELGRRIQSEMLPHAPLHLGLTEVKGVSVPAREVGGDFFNYFVLDSGLVALLVGDVSGKGVGAALLMANIQASLRTRFALGQGLSAIAEAIDHDIGANAPGPLYATLFMAIFDPSTRRMRYVNAGHHPQFVLGRDRRIQKMSSTGLPVGLFAGHGYKELEVQLSAGDLLFFYTDGCVEMENDAGDMFGSDRLEELVIAASAAPTTDVVLATVEQGISRFRGSRDLFDDATMMAVRVG